MKILIILFLSILSGCGFYLRGSPGADYKFPFKTVYIDCGNVIICPNLTTAIKTQMLAAIESSPESAQATIKLVKEETSRDAQDFTGVGRVSSYLLTYQVTTQIFQRNEQVGNDIVVSVQTTMQYNDTIILSSNQNEVSFWNQLHEAATNQLVKRITFLKIPVSSYDK